MIPSFQHIFFPEEKNNSFVPYHGLSLQSPASYPFPLFSLSNNTRTTLYTSVSIFFFSLPISSTTNKMLRPTSHHLIILLILTGLTLLSLLALLTQHLYRHHRNRRQAREMMTAGANLGPLDEEIKLAEGEESFEGVKTKNKKRRVDGIKKEHVGIGEC